MNLQPESLKNLRGIPAFCEFAQRKNLAGPHYNLGNLLADEECCEYAEEEYEKALEKYNRSLTISEEIGNKLNIALTLAQVGGLKYEQKRYQEAISALSKAISIFEELESPYLELAMKDLGSIKEEIGEDEFDEIIQN